eukprot:CAMPEP_0117681866 /NCGR_PEP_ID=MMETSP0804-20121206/19260_1 /TAXON_ID=1074897 /ORGANISM="Tetraselmis astigmatica, Strain CCMP880" /LENGTH=127 /DNA_ID=CAMNT_0005491751 /DNA_START=406 /DNA_END=789 /DNA_ORIENTATION=-
MAAVFRQRQHSNQFSIGDGKRQQAGFTTEHLPTWRCAMHRHMEDAVQASQGPGEGMEGLSLEPIQGCKNLQGPNRARAGLPWARASVDVPIKAGDESPLLAVVQAGPAWPQKGAVPAGVHNRGQHLP